MSRRALLAALSLAALAASCGKSKAEEAYEKLRAICAGLTPGAMTIREALSELSGGSVRAACSGSLGREGDDDQCALDGIVCEQDVAFFQSDRSACTSGPGGGCFFGCVLRANEVDVRASGLDAQLCGRFFYEPQATPYIP